MLTLTPSLNVKLMFFVTQGTCRSLRQRWHVDGRMRHRRRRMRRGGPLQIHLLRGAAFWTRVSAVGLHRTRLTLIKARRHVANLMRQHVLLHIALMTTGMRYLNWQKNNYNFYYFRLNVWFQNKSE